MEGELAGGSLPGRARCRHFDLPVQLALQLCSLILSMPSCIPDPFAPVRKAAHAGMPIRPSMMASWTAHSRAPSSTPCCSLQCALWEHHVVHCFYLCHQLHASCQLRTLPAASCCCLALSPPEALVATCPLPHTLHQLGSASRRCMPPDLPSTIRPFSACCRALWPA